MCLETITLSFSMDMGIMGAGLATALGALITFLVMLLHFSSAQNSLKFAWPEHLVLKLKKIFTTGFSTFFIDIAMGILTMLFNRQIMRYAGTDALSVYGVIVNISTIVQCCAYSVGQAAQPIISINFGAGKGTRIKQTLKYAPLCHLLFQHHLDPAYVCFPKWFYTYFYGADRGGNSYSSVYYKELWTVLSPAAPEYLFNLLFSVAAKASGLLFCL